MKQTAYFEGAEYFTERIAALAGMLQYTDSAFGSGVSENSAAGLKLTLLASVETAGAVQDLDQAITQVQLQVAAKQLELLPHLKKRDALLASRDHYSNAVTASLARLESYLQGGNPNQPFLQYLQQSHDLNFTELTRINAELENINFVITPIHLKMYREYVSGVRALQSLVSITIDAARSDIHGSWRGGKIKNDEKLIERQWQQFEEMLDEAEKKLMTLMEQGGGSDS